MTGASCDNLRSTCRSGASQTGAITMRWMPARFVFTVLALQSLPPLAADPPFLPHSAIFPIGPRGWHHYEESTLYRWRLNGYSSIYQGVMVPGYVGYPSRWSRWNPYYVARWLPPIYQPPGLLFGPQAAHRFMGIDPSGYSFATRRRIPSAPVRKSNAETRRQAERMIDFGDRCFANQRFHQALQHYRTASSVARDVAETYFRISLGQFDRATRAFKRALAMKPSLQRGGFAVTQLYQDNQIAKETHLEALAKAAWKHAHDDDLLFLLGVFLHYDGQTDRARNFFRKASELAGPIRSHLLPFLPLDPPQKKEQVVVQRLEI